MNRRNFLSLTGAMVASPLLAGCSFSKNNGLDISRISKTDVLVIGGGPAGVCAALASARSGVDTMLVESGGCLGGMATKGLVAPFMTCYDTTGEVMVIRGIFSEIVDRMVEMRGAIHPSKVRATSPYSAWITAGHDHVTPFEAEALKVVLDNMTMEAGVKVLLHTSFVTPVIRKNEICGAVVLTRGGLETIEAKVVIDATGDGDVAFRSGVPCSFGNPDTGGVQPASLFFHINNVNSVDLEADVEKHLHEFRKVNGVSYRALHWRVAEAEAAGEWDIARKSVNIYKCVKNDEWAVNSTRIAKVDATSSESLTSAEMEGRRQVQELMHFFHKYVPGCSDATLKSSGSVVGIRESRHVEGEHILQAEDLIGAVVPQDSILLASNSVDVHGSGGTNATQYRTVEGGRWYGVPYRCLVPKGVENLLIAGRCLSATSDAAGAVRVIPPAMAMGQAAGTAAALCVKSGCTPGGLAFDELKDALLRQNVFLG